MKYTFYTLSKKAWDEFSYKMAHPRLPRPIDIFFSNMPSIKSIRHEGKDVIVEYDDLNEEEILKALKIK